MPPLARALLVAPLVVLAACRRHEDVYPADIVQAFMKACTSRGSERACRCTIDALQRRFTVEQFNALEARAREGERPKELMELAVDCTR